jgi:hypothetical protein
MMDEAEQGREGSKGFGGTDASNGGAASCPRRPVGRGTASQELIACSADHKGTAHERVVGSLLRR